MHFKMIFVTPFNLNYICVMHCGDGYKNQKKPPRRRRQGIPEYWRNATEIYKY